jgi:hypothetical protein
MQWADRRGGCVPADAVKAAGGGVLWVENYQDFVLDF